MLCPVLLKKSFNEGEGFSHASTKLLDDFLSLHVFWKTGGFCGVNVFKFLKYLNSSFHAF